MRLNPYLHFDGNCREAFGFYEQVLGGKVIMMLTHADAPPDMQGPPESQGRIMHARMDVGGTVLMGSDTPIGRWMPAQGFMVSLNIDDPAEADRAFAALAEGGAVHMPIAETFWAHRFGILADKFGIPWMVNCEKAG